MGGVPSAYAQRTRTSGVRSQPGEISAISEASRQNKATHANECGLSIHTTTGQPHVPGKKIRKTSCPLATTKAPTRTTRRSTQPDQQIPIYSLSHPPHSRNEEGTSVFSPPPPPPLPPPPTGCFPSNPPLYVSFRWPPLRIARRHRAAPGLRSRRRRRHSPRPRQPSHA